MATSRTLTLVAAALAAGALSAAEMPAALKLKADQASQNLMSRRQGLGLDEHHAFQARRAHGDELGQFHTRLKQLYKGVRVWGGEAIFHQDANGNELPATLELRRNLNLAVAPTLEAKEALAVAHQVLNPKGPYAYEPTAELVVYPMMKDVVVRRAARGMNDGDDMTVSRQVMRYVLAYHVHTELENGVGETAHTDFMIDAHSGAILEKWNTLRTTDATGTGNSQHSGTVTLHTNLSGSTYQLYDVYRGMNIKTYNLNHATSGTGTLYTDADNTWGDGSNYPTGSGTSTTGATGQTAAVDAHYGVEMTYDFYKNVLGRNGIDGNGTATYSRVHYSTSYDNAFWSDSCFCMTYGDGSDFKQLASMDVAAHEMSHGVCANTADLNYSGEPGGLNEANSDMFGAVVELYARNNGTLPATVSNTDACWTMGEDLSSTPLRYMYKPSLDGSSPNAWSSSTGSLDVHYSSGPANRMFFFLSQGASSTSSSNYYSSYAPNGFTGIGPEKAIKIWWRALSTYMTSTTNYAGARTACLNAATDLYGASSAEYAAVQNAFGAINVGSIAPTGVTVAISPTTATVQTGATYQFTATVSGTTSTGVTWTCTGGTVSSTGLFTAPTTAGTYTVKATSTADTTKSASATVTVTAAQTVSVSISPATVSLATGGTQQFTATVSGTTNTSVTWTCTGGTVSTSGLYTAPTTAGTYTVKATSAADTSRYATSTVTVTATSGSGTEKILNGGFESGATSWTGTTGAIGTWSGQPAYEGTRNLWLGGNGKTATESLYQQVTIPSSATSATLSFYLHIDTAETTTSTAYDKCAVTVKNSSGTTLKTLATYSNLNKATGYQLRTFDLSAYKGQTVRVHFNMTEDAYLQTSFVVDKVSLQVK